jgi:hypothetical protein
MLSLKQLQNVCLAFSNGSGKCRYCGVDDDDSTKYFCNKKTKDKSEIDAELVEHMRDLRSRGIDPYKQDIPLGDNCPGYPILRSIQQGYDQN